ncbi:MAG: FAD-binding oxidoreductase, partial [Pseudomonadota bacterium]
MSAGACRHKKFWGWGYEDEPVPLEEAAAVRAHIAGLLGPLDEPLAVPTVGAIDLPRPRLEVPSTLQAIASAEPIDRLTHAYGKSFP